LTIATADAEALAPEPPTPLPRATRLRITFYLGGLFILLGFAAPAGGLIGLPISFFLKNKLHLMAHQVALFGLIASAPVYFAVAFGFVRDIWNPLGMRDRGYMTIFGALGAIACLVSAFAPPTYAVLLAAVLVLTTAALFIDSAARGLTSTIGQQHAMTGQVSAAWNAFASLPAIAALLAGGLLSDLVEGAKAAQGARILFFVGAVVNGAIALYGLWRPASVFDNVHSERPEGAPLAGDLARLVRHWPIYPALLIWLLWQFVPGLNTPLQYFLQDKLHGSDAQFGQWWALYLGGYIPVYLLYGALCRRFALKWLLLWGALASLPMMFPLLVIHGMAGALLVAAPMGLLGGLGTASFLDLIIRSCPKGLQGTVLMAAAGVFAIDGQFGNVLGTALYDHFHDFTVCVIAMTVTDALILPALLLVPGRLVATADGQAAAADGRSDSR
jgi:hypothetical protein